MQTKKELRQHLRKILSDITPDEHASKSLSACHRLFKLKEYCKSEVIMTFLSLSSEIDTAPIVLRAWQERKRIVAPKVSWEQRRMLPIEIRSLTDDLTVSQMGVREPASGTPIPIEMIDLIIVPGLGFDAFGNRLGRGRGFYDRFLAHPEFRGITCAMAFEEQVTQNIPVGPLDKQIDILITDKKVRHFRKK